MVVPKTDLVEYWTPNLLNQSGRMFGSAFSEISPLEFALYSDSKRSRVGACSRSAADRFVS